MENNLPQENDFDTIGKSNQESKEILEQSPDAKSYTSCVNCGYGVAVGTLCENCGYECK